MSWPITILKTCTMSPRSLECVKLQFFLVGCLSGHPFSRASLSLGSHWLHAWTANTYGTAYTGQHTCVCHGNGQVVPAVCCRLARLLWPIALRASSCCTLTASVPLFLFFPSTPDNSLCNIITVLSSGNTHFHTGLHDQASFSSAIFFRCKSSAISFVQF
jgi:hypothetical protein